MMNQKERKKSVLKSVLLTLLFGVIFVFSVAAITVCAWYATTFDLEFKELLYTLASPLKGTGESTVSLIVSTCVPPVCVCAVCFFIVAGIFWIPKRVFYYCRRIGAALCIFLLIGSLIFSSVALRLPAYLCALMGKTTIYEDYYVDPDNVLITSDGKTKNLIYIYLESMETTYASVEDGGNQHANFMPLLTELAAQNVSFSDKAGQLGGFHTPLGTGWTMAALLATTSGIPFSFSVGENGHNTMGQREKFAAGLTTLGDILEDKGYAQMFLCGSDGDFGGRKNYFEQHGGYEVFDYYKAKEVGYIPPDYGVWWGYEDEILYNIARQELIKMAAGDQPFNFTMLTVDTHHVDGYVCDICDDRWGNRLANVVNCADRQLAEFIAWCQEQDFYEDTAIVITGDHPRMDTTLVSEVEYDDRVIYNCFINAATEPKGAVSERVFTSFDIFPTTLAAMGFTIEGDRLGLGVNMFSDKETLAEQMGYLTLQDEITKFSYYYIREFS